MPKAINLERRRFGRLKVGELTRIGKARAWICDCDCGNQVAVKADLLLNGKVKSCGCLNWSEEANNRRAMTQLLKMGERGLVAHLKRTEQKISQLREAAKKIKKAIRKLRNER